MTPQDIALVLRDDSHAVLTLSHDDLVIVARAKFPHITAGVLEEAARLAKSGFETELAPKLKALSSDVPQAVLKAILGYDDLAKPAPSVKIKEHTVPEGNAATIEALLKATFRDARPPAVKKAAIRKPPGRPWGFQPEMCRLPGDECQRLVAHNGLCMTCGAQIGRPPKPPKEKKTRVPPASLVLGAVALRERIKDGGKFDAFMETALDHRSALTKRMAKVFGLATEDVKKMVAKHSGLTDKRSLHGSNPAYIVACIETFDDMLAAHMEAAEAVAIALEEKRIKCGGPEARRRAYKKLKSLKRRSK